MTDTSGRLPYDIPPMNSPIIKGLKRKIQVPWSEGISLIIPEIISEMMTNFENSN